MMQHPIFYDMIIMYEYDHVMLMYSVSNCMRTRRKIIP